MGFTVPTAQDVRESFRQALAQAGRGTETATRNDFDVLYRSASNPAWVNRGTGVETMEVGGRVRLLRVAFTQFIDNHRGGQAALIAASTGAVGQVIRSAIPSGAVVDFMFEFPPEQDVPFGKSVTCLATGIVR